MQEAKTKAKHSKFTAVWIVFPLAAIAYTTYKFLTADAAYRDTFSQYPIVSSYVFGILSTYFVMIVMESFFKYDKGVDQSKYLLRDVCSNTVHFFVTGPVGRLAMVPIIAFLLNEVFGRGLVFADRMDAGPIWLQSIFVFLFYSLMRYSIHYYQHHNKYLWELHSYHHAVTDIQTSNTLVSHPLDYFLRNIFPPIVLGVMGFHLAAIAIATTIIGTFAVFSHCGAGLHAGWLSKIFVTPELHRWHHSKEVPEGHKYSVNYGVGVILWDRIFGTYYLPMKDGVPLQPEKLGHPSGYPDEPNYLKFFFLTRHWPKALKFWKKPEQTTPAE